MKEEKKGRLQGKTVFLTGASAGIGRSMAFALAEEGASLILTARRKDRLEALGKELTQTYGAKTQVLTMDLTDTDSIFKGIDSLSPPWRKIDILINNAGLALGLEPAQTASWRDWQTMIGTNLMGLAAVTHALLPSLIQSKEADIVNIGSIAGDFAYGGAGMYCATKSAVKTFTDGLRIDLVHLPIRVSLIKPGMAKTDFSLVRFKGDEKRADSLYENMLPLLGEDVARVLIFMLTQPAHVCLSEVTVLPTDQANGMVRHSRATI